MTFSRGRWNFQVGRFMSVNSKTLEFQEMSKTSSLVNLGQVQKGCRIFRTPFVQLEYY